MGKTVKAELKETDGMAPETAGMNEAQNPPEDGQNKEGIGIQLQLVPPKTRKKTLLDVIWRDRGIVGKTATVVGAAGLTTGIVFGVKALVALVFGPEAAEMIDPSMIAPTEE